MKKQYEERLSELEGRLSERDSLDADREKLRAAITDMNESVERRLKELQDQLQQQTDDKCLKLEKVCKAVFSVLTLLVGRHQGIRPVGNSYRLDFLRDAQPTVSSVQPANHDESGKWSSKRFL